MVNSRNCFPPFTINYSLFTLLSLSSSLQLAQLVGDASIRDVDPVNFRKSFYGAIYVTHLLISRAEFKAQSLILFFRVTVRFEPLLEPHGRDLRHILLHEAVAQQV